MRTIALALALVGCGMDMEPPPDPGGECPRIWEASFRHRAAYGCQAFCPVIEAECTAAELDACLGDVGRAFDCATLQAALEGCHCDTP